MTACDVLRWERMTHRQIAAAARPRTVVVQPIGATEQHGPHLPSGVDTIIAGALVDAAARLVPDDVVVLVLPALPYGKSNEHIGLPGTIALSAATLTSLCLDLGRSVAASGFTKLAFVNGHGGQPHLLETVARDIRIETGLHVFPIFPYRLPAMAEIASADGEWGIHAGETETSLLLHLDPDAVDMTRAAAHIPAVAARYGRYRILSLEGAVPTAWITTDLSPSGVIGDPTAATAEAGADVLARLAADLAIAFAEIADFTFDDT